MRFDPVKHPRDPDGRFIEISFHSTRLVREQKAVNKFMRNSNDRLMRNEEFDVGDWGRRLYEPTIALARDGDTGEVLGYTHFEARTRRIDDSIDIHDVRTSTAARGRGVGTKMIDAVRNVAPERKTRVYNSIRRARGFYEKTGATFGHEFSSTAEWPPLKKGKPKMSVDLAVTPTPGGRMADSGSMAKPGYKGKQKLDPYVRQIARALMRRGKSESDAIAIAKTATRRWARGGKKVRPQVRAGAAASVGNQARIDSLSNTGSDLDLARGPLRYRHGWVKLDGGEKSGVTIMGRDVQAVGKAPRGGPAGYARRDPSVLKAALAERTRRTGGGSATVTYDGHDDYSDLKIRKAKHRAKKARPTGVRVATASLSNRATVDITDLAHWSPNLHPRDWRGRFVGKGGLKGPLDDKGRVVPHPHEVAAYQVHVREADKKIIENSPRISTDVTHAVKKDDGSLEWAPERRKIQRQIVDTVYKREAKHAKADRKALFLGGLPGAGKSTSISRIPGLDEQDYITINPDIFKEELARRGHIPELEGLTPMEASAFVHEESSAMALMLAARATKNGKNIIWDITMNSAKSVKTRQKPLAEAGYKTQAVFVDIPFEMSQRRVEQRHQSGHLAFTRDTTGMHLGQRLVPSSHVHSGAPKKGMSSANREAFEEVKNTFGAYKLYDNSGDTPRTLEERGQFNP